MAKIKYSVCTQSFNPTFHRLQLYLLFTRKCFEVDVFGPIQLLIQRIDKLRVKRSAKNMILKGVPKKNKI